MPWSVLMRPPGRCAALSIRRAVSLARPVPDQRPFRTQAERISMIGAQRAKLLALVALCARTSRLVTALQVPVDDAFDAVC